MKAWPTSRARGSFVALLGVDGSGKSTVANLLHQRLSDENRPCTCHHWRPYILPSPRRLFGDKPTYDADNPHDKNTHSLGISTFLSMYYFADFWIGHLFKVLPELKAGQCVIFERYFYDALADPQRYRLINTRLLDFLARLVPTPMATIVLLGDADILNSRKGELSVAEINVQQTRFRDRLPPSCHPLWLDVTTLRPPEVVEKIYTIIEG